MITIRNLQKSYGELKVLKGINLEIEKSKITTIVGASGAGKSTLLHLIGTLDKPNDGTIIINGTSLFQLSDNELSKYRNRHIGFIFQFHHLLPEFTALENITLPALIAGRSKKEAVARALELLDFLQLRDRVEHKPNQLSGGEQQRVAVARALINNPDLVLADEPSGNLDSENARKLHQLFFDLRDQFQQTFVIVTHNQELAKLSDRIITLKDGLVVE
ncbi:MAG TPA: ABC transporter ATP-binding protein [Bacteroidales bacterium]|jgi:lipoprotein-releasing system ATP-binding protein|nr:ABC transporter ATP-binding protein [Bacteroidales bacterium]HOF45488.1 ABC transporter ATP-binding protein [Bacteroidales bacterium]HOS57095.1 ABC transporter ATP-binding protein [Bacteroidales bacterium]HRR04304.1 ABC transporter ATP-binding protein [Bacteroidales bacterium]HRT13061.1 ABC transporter ATP-binding protein [Bacteroidales bacterium]